MTEDNKNKISLCDDNGHIGRMIPRQQPLFQAIVIAMKPIMNIYKIGFFQDDQHKEYSYAVIIKKDPNRGFIQRVIEFEQCLRENLTDGEQLYYNNRCFSIRANDVSINYCLEGYAKQSDREGYFECVDGDPKTMEASESFTHRMPMHVAFRWIRKHCSSADVIIARTNLQEMKEAYPNPGDRFIASVRIEKQNKIRRMI